MSLRDDKDKVYHNHKKSPLKMKAKNLLIRNVIKIVAQAQFKV